MSDRPTPPTFDPYPWNQNGPGRSHRPEVMYPCDDGEWVKLDDYRDLERKLAEANEQLAAMAKHEAAALESDSVVASCNCGKKSPDIQHHARGCKYRLIVERDESRTKLAEARVALEDKRRLDCLEANQKTVWRALRVEWQATTEADVARRKVTVFEGWVIDDDDDPSPTIRGAIDKALARIDKNASGMGREDETPPHADS